MQSSFPVFEFKGKVDSTIHPLSSQVIGECIHEFGILFQPSNNFYFWNRESFLMENCLFLYGKMKEEEKRIAIDFVRLLLIQMDLVFPITFDIEIHSFEKNFELANSLKMR